MVVDLLGVVDSVYEAAASPCHWPDALARTATVVGAGSGVLLYGVAETDVEVLATFGDLGDEYRRPLPGLVTLLAGRSAGEPFSVDPQHLTAQVASSSRQVAERPPGAGEALALALLHGSGAVAALLLLPPAGSSFGPRELDLLGHLAPHLVRAVGLHHRVETAEKWALASCRAFDRIAAGAILVDAGGRVLLANRTARRVLDRDDGLGEGRDGLRGAAQEDTRALRTAIREVAARARREGAGLVLERPSGAPPFEVIVLPLGPEPAAPAHGGAAAIVFVTDRTLAPAGPRALLRDLYGLTAAETRLVLLLLAGQGPPDAAAALGISRHTAHSQLAAVFRKTGTTSQPALVRVLLRGAAGVRPAGESSASLPRIDLADWGN